MNVLLLILNMIHTYIALSKVVGVVRMRVMMLIIFVELFVQQLDVFAKYAWQQIQPKWYQQHHNERE